jgi:hypothetical protein
MRIAKREVEEEDLQKEEARKLRAAATAYNKQVAEEKRQKAASEKEERERKCAEQRQAIDARKADRARERQERDSQNRSQTAERASARPYINKELKRGRNVVLQLYRVVVLLISCPQHLRLQ